MLSLVYNPKDPLPIDVTYQAEQVENQFTFWLTSFVFLLSLLIILVLAINLGFILAKSASSLPDIRLLENWHPSESTLIYDRNGEFIANIHGDEDRVVVPLSQMSPYIKKAVLAIEDNRFYQHNGVDIRGTVRAIVTNIKGGEVQGGSTVTQQLVKNLFLTPERSVGRKLAEAILAVRVEQFYSKDRILEMYLNQVYFGNLAYGIEKASQRYFNVSARDLTLPQAALLAGLLKAPEGLSPYRYARPAFERQALVVDTMAKFGYISLEEAEKAHRTKLTLRPPVSRPSKHPYFVNHVIAQLNHLFGEDTVRRGGLRVYTSIRTDVQGAAEEILEKAVKKYSVYGVDQGALISMDVATGQIVSMVGGVNFEKNQFNNATMARRSIGSTMKPFVYLTGLRLGAITPNSTLVDSPIRMSLGGGRTWSPKNWDNRYMGAMSARRALALSRNTTTIRLGQMVGLDNVIETCRLVGFTDEIPENYSSLLGSIGVSPLELMQAYGVIARGGIFMKPTSFVKILGVEEAPLPLPPKESKVVFDSAPINDLVTILVDVVRSGTGRNAQLPGRVVAGKTGTTDRHVDVWFAGFTPDTVTVVWLGNSKNRPLKGLFSSNAANVWHDFMARYYALNPTPSGRFGTGDKRRRAASEWEGAPPPSGPDNGPAAGPNSPAQPVNDGPNEERGQSVPDGGPPLLPARRPRSPDGLTPPQSPATPPAPPPEPARQAPARPVSPAASPTPVRQPAPPPVSRPLPPPVAPPTPADAGPGDLRPPR